MNNIKKFWGTTTIYSIGFLCLRAVSFLLLPLYTNLLSPSEAGFLFILYTILAFFNTIYSHGMDSSLLKYYQKNNLKTIFTTSIIYSIFYSITLSILLYFFYIYFDPHLNPIYYNDFTIPIIYIILLILICDMLSSRCIIVVRLLENPIYYLTVGLVNVMASLYLNIYFINVLKMGLNGAILALALVSCLQLLLLLPIIITNVKINTFDYQILTKMIHFSIPFLPASIFFILIEMSDRWMLSWLSSIQDVGLYGSGYKIGSVILLIVNSFNLNWQPYYLKNQNKYDDFKNIGTKFLFILILLCTILSVLWSTIFKINYNSYFLIGKEFWSGGSIIPLITISYLFYGIFILQMPSIYIKNKQNWVPIIWGLGALLNFAGNYILIPIFGFYGAAISTLISYSSMAIFLIYKNTKWLPIKYNINNLMPIIIISLLIYFYQYYYNLSSILIILLLIIYLIIAYYLNKKIYQ